MKEHVGNYEEQDDQNQIQKVKYRDKRLSVVLFSTRTFS